jgi:hypothetical protein
MENASEVEGQDVGNSTSLHNILRSILESNQNLQKAMSEMKADHQKLQINIDKKMSQPIS